MRKAYRVIRHASPGFIWKPIRRAVHDIAMEAGYRRDAEPSPCDLRGLIDDPLEALERANGTTALVEIPMARCRTLHALAFPAHPESDNPYILTARWMQATSQDDQPPEESPLSAYFEAVQPLSAAQFFGIRSDRLSSLTPIAAEWPWTGPSGRPVQLRRHNTVAKEARVNGWDLAAGHGWQHVGPVTEEKLRLELERTANLVRSIGRSGYRAEQSGLRRGLDQIRGLLLVNERGEWRFVVDGGEHRVAVLAALGHATFPGVVRPDGVYYRSGVEEWPGVAAGDVGTKEATRLFDRVFAGEPPGFVETAWSPVAACLRQALRDHGAREPDTVAGPADSETQ